MFNYIIKLILLGILVVSNANGFLEIGINQVGSNKCNLNVEGKFLDVKSESEVISIFFNPNEQPIIFNNCTFLSVDKKKRKVEVYGGLMEANKCSKQKCNIIFTNFKQNSEDSLDVAFSLISNEKSAVEKVQIEPAKIVPKVNNSKLLIAIDAGHGGQDPGAIGGGGTQEKDLTLKYAKHIKKVLENAGYKVFLTRSSDEYLKLYERIDISMLKNADIFISIHADSAKNKKARGATIYTLSPSALNDATKKADARLNLTGNFVEDVKDADLLFNILNIQHSSNVRQSFDFANSLKEKMSNLKINFTSVPIRAADFAVLKAPTFPAILLEIGYISNAEDERMLNSREYMDKIAVSIKRAIDEVK
jgi:N-acetylmuramoyl-L-alanine amidase